MMDHVKATFFVFWSAATVSLTLVPQSHVNSMRRWTSPGNRVLLVRSGEPASDESRDIQLVEALVLDDEWEELRLELTAAVKQAVLADLQDVDSASISEEVESRIMDEVAKMRGKDQYESGDLVAAMGSVAKLAVQEVTGIAEYEAKEAKARVESALVAFTGKDNYEFGDVSLELDRRVKERVSDFTGKPDYTFGDISAEIERRRREWVRDFLGQDAAENYQFGDITKQAIRKLTGKSEYEFGDVSRSLLGKILGKSRSTDSNGGDKSLR